MKKPAASPHQLQDSRSVKLELFHVVPSGLSLDAVLDPSYWRNAWKVLDGKTNSTIELVAEDGAWEAMARVLSAKDGIVKLRVVSKWEADRSKASVPDGFKVEFIPGKGWRALDTDNTVIVDGEPAEADAIAAAVARAKKYAAPRKSAA
jgi:hypothetical protein